MKHYLLIVFCVLTSTSVVFGQRWAQVFEEGGSYLEVKKAFNSEWQGKSYERSKGYKQFKRFENFYEPRLYPDYEWPDPMIVWNEMEAANKKKKKKQNHNRSASTSTWTPIGPTSWTDGAGWNAGLGRINVVMVDPNNSSTIYVGAPAGGLWKSTNNGSSWTCLTDDQPVLGVSDMQIDPSNSNIIYLATGDGDASDTYSVGVLKSTNGGNTWTTTGLNFQVTQTRRIRRLIMHPTNSNILFAATTAGLYKTTNGGNSWTQVNSNSFQDLAFKPGSPNVVYAVNDEFYKSTNTGNSFTQITNGLPPDNEVNRYKIGVSDDEPNWVYLVCGKQSNSTFKGMYRSTNSGNSFTLQANSPNIFGYSTTGSDNSGQSWYDLAIAVDPNDASTMWVGGVNVWKSTDGGVTYTIQSNWTYPNAIGYTHADIHYLNIYNGDVYCGSDGGIFVSSDGGNNWTDKSAGLQITQFYKLSTSQTNSSLVLGGTQDNGTNLYSGSNNWTHVVGADGMECIINPVNSNVMYAAIQFGSIRKSTNGGNSFSGILNPDQVNDTGAWVTPYVLDPNNPNHIYVGYTELYKSTNGGNTFSQVSNLNNSNTLRVVEVCKANSSVIYLGRGSKVFRSSNGGTNFTNVTGNLPNKTVRSIITDPLDENRIWVCLSGYNNNQKVYFSSNGGNNWTNLSSGLPNLPTNCLVYREGSTDEIYCGTDVGIYMLTGNSGSWTPFGTGLPNVIVEELEITYSVDKIRAATYGRGMWEADLADNCATDVAAPVINCPTNIPSFYAVGSNSCQLSVSLPVATATDDCTTNPDLSWRYIETDITGSPLPGAVYSAYSTAGAFTFDVGYYTIDWLAEDESGNSSNCDYQIEIRDIIPPVPNCINNTIELGANGTVVIGQSDVSSGPTDNCGINFVSVFPNEFSCSELGPNNVDVLVLDENGNTANCTSVINVFDLTNPSALCVPSLLIGLNNGSTQINTALIDAGSTDNCSISSMILDQSIFDCDDLGTNLVTLSVFDSSGNQADCTTQVIVESFAPVIAVCQDLEVFLNGSGTVDVDASQVDGGSTFDCGNLNFSLDNSSFDCLSIGANDVVLTVDNGLGDSDQCNAVIQVADLIPPVLICNAVTLALDANGLVNLTVSDIDNGSFDNCDFDLSLSSTTLDCADLGDNDIIMSASDASGNLGACNSLVTVVDNLAPTALCAPNLSVSLDPDGTYTLNPTDIDNGSFDNCSELTSVLSVSLFDCDDIGVQNVNLTVIDGSGNTSSCTSAVTVLDGSIPAMVCSDITVSLDEQGMVTILPEDINSGSSVSCGDLDLDLSVSEFDCTQVGLNSIVLTGTSDAGNQSTCISTVIVQDDTPPLVSCNVGLNFALDQNGQFELTTSDVLNAATDNCSSSLQYSLDISSFTCEDLGSTTVNLSAFDDFGNLGSCSAEIIIEDQNAPSLSCLDADIMLLDSDPIELSLESLVVSAIDNCDNDVSITTDHSLSFDCANAGDNTIELTATDSSNNSTTCSVNVFVDYNAVPVAVCNQGVEVELNEAGVVNVSPELIDGGSYALCDTDLNLSLSQASFSCDNIGLNSIELVVSNSGGLNSCFGVIEVLDNTPPSLNCIDMVVELDFNGEFILNYQDLVAGSSDNCETVILIGETSFFDCSSVGMNTVSILANDGSGNQTTCESEVEVLDVTPPVAICNDIIVELDDEGIALIDVNEIGSLSFDLCSDVNLELSQNTLDCESLDSLVLITLFVTDASGNITDCEAEVEVIDLIGPELICKSTEVLIGTNNTGTLEPVDIIESYFDNCSEFSYNLGQTVFDCDDLGVQEVTLYITDGGNNLDSCTVSIDVLDDSNPQASCYSELELALDETGNLEVLLEDIYSGSAVSCNGFEYQIEPQFLDCTNLDDQISVSLTIEGSNGANSECSTQLTVLDVSPPVAICTVLDTVLTDGVDIVLYPELFDGGSYDACGSIQYMDFDTLVLGCSNLGNSDFEWNIIDSYGNNSSCTASLNLSNNMTPIANCEDVTITLDENGVAVLDPQALNNGSTDACGNADGITISADLLLVDCEMIGAEPTATELIVSDINSGISASCTAYITVLDQNDPNINFIQDITTFSTAGDEPEIFNVSMLNAIVSDNCAVSETLIKRESGDCEDSNEFDSFVYFCPEDGDGLYPVTFRVVDESLNTKDSLVYVDLDNLMVSTAETDQSTDQVYCVPNPFLDKTTLHIDLVQSKDINVNIFSLDGKLVEQMAVSLEAGRHTIELEMSDMASGVYYCSLNTSTWNEVIKLIKVSK